MAFRVLSLATLIQSLMWSLFIITDRRHFLCPSALRCTGSNGWPCPRFTPKAFWFPLNCLSSGCLKWVCAAVF